jgi:bacterioferritin
MNNNPTQHRKKYIMRGDPQMMLHLNKILYNELTAINQYFLHARMYKDKGLNALNEKVYQGSIEEMQHADMLIERILFLEGVPNLQNLGQLMIGATVREMLECDAKLEQQGLADLKPALAYAEQIQDIGSRDLLEKIVQNEEEHLEWLDIQLRQIEEIGLNDYCQTQM